MTRRQERSRLREAICSFLTRFDESNGEKQTIKLDACERPRFVRELVEHILGNGLLPQNSCAVDAIVREAAADIVGICQKHCNRDGSIISEWQTTQIILSAIARVNGTAEQVPSTALVAFTSEYAT